MRRFGIPALIALAIGISGLWSCAGPPDVDSGPEDSGGDGPDTVADVPDDSSDTPPEPEWVRVSGFPDDCVLERAVDPASVVSTHWEPCPEVAEGCEVLRFDRVPGTVSALQHGGFGNDRTRGVVVASYTGEIGAIEHSYRSLMDAGGAAASVWRYRLDTDTLCLPWPVTVDENAAVMVMAGYPERDVRLTRAALNEIGTTDAFAWRSTRESFPDAQQPQYPSMSDTTFVVGLAPRGFVLVIEGDRWAHVAGPTLPRPGAASPSAVVGHHVFFDWSSADLTTQEIQVATIDEPARTLYVAAVDRVIAFVVSDGTWIAWRAAIRPAMVGDVIDFTELWVAPYTTDPAAFAPRLVRDDLVAGEQQTIGDGYYAMADARTGVPHYVRVVSLSDGSARRLELPTGDPSVVWGVTGRPLWVTRDEVVVPAARRVDGVPEHIVLRIPVASLRPEP